MNIFIFSLSLLTYISCADICLEDGLISNSEDRTAYFECKDGVQTLMRCPITDDQNRYMVFNGQQCVDFNVHSIQIAPGPHADPHDAQPQRGDDTQANEEFQADNVICPTGTSYNSGRGKCIGQEFAAPMKIEEPVTFLSKLCTRDQVYDSSLHKCRALEYAEPIKVVTQGHNNHSFQCPKYDGNFPDPRDEKCYFICQNNVAHHRVCPGSTVFTGGDGGRCLYSTRPEIMVNDGYHTYPARLRPRQVDDDDDDDDVYCEPGTIYDPETEMCKREEITDSIAVIPTAGVRVTTECPTGYFYNDRTGKCTREVSVTPLRGESQVVGEPTLICPNGFTYHQQTGMCRKEELIDPIVINRPSVEVTTRCPSDTRYDQRTGRCIREEIVDPIREEVPAVAPSFRCPDGFTYDPATGRCRRVDYVDPNQIRRCPIGQSLDYLGRCVSSTIGNVCMGNAYCPPDYTMDTYAQNCSSTITVRAIRMPGNRTFTCTNGYTFDWVLHKCLSCQEIPVRETPGIDTDSCPETFNMDRNRNICLRIIWTPPITQDRSVPCKCEDGYEWRPNMFQCVRIFTEDCIRGSCPPIITHEPYRPPSGRLYNCPPGSTYDRALGECRASVPTVGRRGTICPGIPICPNGYTMDRLLRNCTTEITTQYIRKPGTPTYSCAAGYTYDPVFHKCRRCEERPVEETPGQDRYVCPSNGFGHFVYNELTQQCTKVIHTPPIHDYTLAPCDCSPGFYWSHHLLKCVRVELAPCTDGSCPPNPYPFSRFVNAV